MYIFAVDFLKCICYHLDEIKKGVINMPFEKLTRYLDLLPEVYGIPICELSVCKGYEKVYSVTVMFSQKTVNELTDNA